jgi:hypothetical protein
LVRKLLDTGDPSRLETQFAVGNLQQSPAPAGSFAPASSTTFQLPSGSLRHMVM